MSMNVTPIISTPITDLFGLLGHHQHFGRCADFEMRMMECMEAYGHGRAQIKCRDLIDDFNECHTKNKQKSRELRMRLERHRQLIRGERAWKDHYDTPPKLDSY